MAKRFKVKGVELNAFILKRVEKAKEKVRFVQTSGSSGCMHGSKGRSIACKKFSRLEPKVGYRKGLRELYRSIEKMVRRDGKI